MSRRFQRSYRPAGGQAGPLSGPGPSPISRRRFLGSTGAALLLMRWHRRGTLCERELLELTAREFRLTRTARDGAVSIVALEPSWLRLERTTPPPCLWLASHGRRLRIGRALTEEELGELHEALRAALARWRAGPEGTR